MESHQEGCGRWDLHKLFFKRHCFINAQWSGDSHSKSNLHVRGQPHQLNKLDCKVQKTQGVLEKTAPFKGRPSEPRFRGQGELSSQAWCHIFLCPWPNVSVKLNHGHVMVTELQGAGREESWEQVELSSGLSCFLIAVIKIPNKISLREKGFILSYNSIGIWPIMAGDTWQQTGKAWRQAQEAAHRSTSVLWKPRVNRK